MALGARGPQRSVGRAIALSIATLAMGGGVAVCLLAREPANALHMVAWTRGARLIDDTHGVRQQQSNDCGPAALAHALRQAGIPFEYPSPQFRVRLGPRGCRLEALLAEAAQVGARAEMRRVPNGEIESVRAPAVLHLRRGHYVVLEGRAPRGRLRIHDPALGLLEQSPAELSKTWSGWVLEVRVSGGSGTPVR